MAGLALEHSQSVAYDPGRKSRLATHWKDEWDTTSDGLGPVELGDIAKPELLVASPILPANDGGAIEKNINTFASRQRGRDAAGVMADVDLRLRREAGCCGQSHRLVRAVNHGCDDLLSRFGDGSGEDECYD